jgi:RNA polymerase sigma-70 factor (ECF subfamily)
MANDIVLSDRFAAPARPWAATQQILDESLISGIAAGDTLSMRVLFARHHTRVYRFVLRLAGDETIAEDVVSEVFYEVWRQARRFEARSQVSTWLLAIARYRTLTALKRRNDARLESDTAAEIEDPNGDPELAVETKDRNDILRQCLLQLSPAQREVIDLIYYHEKSAAEVAAIVGIPRNTVKTRMFSARKKLSELLKEAGIEAWA